MTEQAKVALVTGASRGIGRAIAEHLGGAGFTVVGTATSDSGAERISDYLREAGNPGCGMDAARTRLLKTSSSLLSGKGSELAPSESVVIRALLDRFAGQMVIVGRSISLATIRLFDVPI